MKTGLLNQKRLPLVVEPHEGCKRSGGREHLLQVLRDCTDDVACCTCPEGRSRGRVRLRGGDAAFKVVREMPVDANAERESFLRIASMKLVN